MARADTYTLLALDRYARILGINPAHFNQAAGTTIMPVTNACADVWFQFSYQGSDSVSREDLARAIYDAEEEVARQLSYYPAPQWIAQELHRYPKHYRAEVNSLMYGSRGQARGVQADFGKIIEPGRRATSLVTAGVAVVYSDPDGDGYNERATVTTPASLTDICEIKVYFAGHSGNQEWEIRPARTKVISGGNAIFTFDAWLLLDPDLWEELPSTGGLGAIALQTPANYVTTVDVYREYNDFTQVSAQFLWERQAINNDLEFCCDVCNGEGCPACELISQDGCAHIRNGNAGELVPIPAEYDSVNTQWQVQGYTACRNPDQVKFWYYAGDLDKRWLTGQSCEALSDYWAHAIAWLATARLERPFCSCGNAQALARDWVTDLAFSGESGAFNLSPSDLDNPFGTKRGEIMAWRRVAKMNPSRMLGVAV